MMRGVRTPPPTNAPTAMSPRPTSQRMYPVAGSSLKAAMLVAILLFTVGITRAATATIPNVSAAAGQVSVPIQVTGFNSVGAISFYILYDAQRLTFQSIQGAVLTGIEANAYQGPGGPTIGISWSSANGANVPNGNLLQLVFTYTGTGIAPLQFDAAQCEVATVIGGTIGFLNVTYTNGSVGPQVLRVSPRVHLSGPYNAATGLMTDGLRAAGLVPLTEPYTALGYAHVGGGGETVSPAVLAVTGTNAIVDWVVVELRHPTQATVLATRSALLQCDGDVVEVDGTTPVGVAVTAGTYRVGIRHRNHLGALTANAFALSSTTTVVDLTSTATATFGTDARRSLTGTFPTLALWPGNVVRDASVRYTGSNNDRDPILVLIGGVIPTNTATGYRAEDVTMDGIVKYTGSNNDRDVVLQTIGGIVPTSVRVEQLP